MKRIKKNNPRPGCKDIWNAFMCKGARFTDFDIPFCPTILSSLPKEIITWSEAKQLHKKLIKTDKNYHYDAFICFYEDDNKFDGSRSSIWLYPWLLLRVLKHFRGIITPDFSTNQDFPYPLTIWNTYRMRVIGYWIGTLGYEVINNVRWGTSESFLYCFSGIEKNSVIAIGTVGGSPKELADRRRFEQGLLELIKRLSPSTILVYGSSNYPCFDRLREIGINIVTYKSATAKYYERRIDQNE